MNTLNRNALFLILLGMSVLILPACGGSNNVKSEKAPETVLNAETTPEATPVSSSKQDIGMPGENTPINTYVEKIHRSKGSKSTTITTTPVDASVSTPLATPSTPVQTPAMESTAPATKSNGLHWFLWLLVILVLGGIGWYFWSKNQSENSGSPNPPVGGLSPVSGFMGVQNQIEDQEENKPSIWSKKLF